MQIVLNISKKLYDRYKEKDHIKRCDIDEFEKAIDRGIILPKGHGGLIDVIKLKAKMFDLPQQPEGNYWDGVDAVGKLIDNTQPIIPADKEK